ncbi:MAG: hypothetical protein LBT08_07485, partial [Synergistaceae bacterium]|nr:hypothetical protein [Synergistaceae bacterium]
MKKKKVMIFVLSVIFIFTALPAAFAHKFVLYPDNFTVPQGGTAGVYWTYTEVIGTPEYSRWGTDYVYREVDWPVEVVYKDGTISDITDKFEPYDFKTKTIVAPEASDSDHARFTINGPGTVVIHGNFRGMMNTSDFGGPDMDVHSISHVKTFLNLTNDGVATKRLGGSGVLEVVFA